MQYANIPNQTPLQAPQYPPRSYDGQASYAAVCIYSYVKHPCIMLNLLIPEQPPLGPPPGWSAPHPDYTAPTGPPPTGDQKHAV